jgi:hypothetical protein
MSESFRPFCERCDYEGAWTKSESDARRAIERHSKTKRHLANGGKSVEAAKAKAANTKGFLTTFRVTP